MGRDITIRVTGQNADGTLNVQQVDGGNPFMSQTQTTAMTTYNPNAAVANPAGSYRAKINGVDITFASEADYLKADRALRDMIASDDVPSVGGIGGTRSSGTMNFLRTGANAADAAAGFLRGRDIRRRIDDLDTALLDSRDARNSLDDLERGGKYNDLIPILRRLFLAERDATESSIAVLESEVTAVDIQTGAGVAKVVADFMEPSSTSTARRSAEGSGSGLGTALAVGGAGLGLGLLLSSRSDSRDRDRRR